jgi:hypothetical protein
MKTEILLSLRPQQIEDLQHDMINKSMSGNAGIAIVIMRKKTDISAADTIALNDRLVNIEIEARREIKKALIDFFNSNNI